MEVWERQNARIPSRAKAGKVWRTALTSRIAFASCCAAAKATIVAAAPEPHIPHACLGSGFM